MNWDTLIASYNLAKDNGFPIRFHILVWGRQQPDWIITAFEMARDIFQEKTMLMINDYGDKFRIFF